MPDNNLPSWRQDLKSSRKKEGKSPSNRWIQLATVSEENEPRLRTVVFRGWHKDSSDNKNYWDLLSEKSKSSWFWGSPGEKINPKVQSTYEILSNLPKSENFVVLNFEIDSVDLLKLEQPVHKRYLWEKSKKWEKVEINP